MAKSKRGRPGGMLGHKTYLELYGRYGTAKQLREYLQTRKGSKVVEQAVKKELHAGRPASEITSMRVIGGHLNVRLAKSRVIRVGNKEVTV